MAGLRSVSCAFSCIDTWLNLTLALTAAVGLWWFVTRCTGAVLDLPKLLPGSFKSGQLVCPEARKVCPTLGCAGGCANGYCWEVRCLEKDCCGRGVLCAPACRNKVLHSRLRVAACGRFAWQADGVSLEHSGACRHSKRTAPQDADKQLDA